MSTNAPVTPSTDCCPCVAPTLSADDAEELSVRLSAMADPTRIQLLSIIASTPGGEVCACDFVGPLAKSQPTISHHLKVLSAAGLIEGDKRGRWIWYRLRTGAVAELSAALASAIGGAD